jgi:two-component system, NtrC family, response regulator HydG
LRYYGQRHHRTVTGISPALLTAWQQYAWPGNVRELQHSIERAVILTGTDVARPGQHVGAVLGLDSWQPTGQSASPTPVEHTLQLETMEKQLIQRALQQHGGNISDVARTLGLSRQALYRRMEKHGL